VKFATSQRSTTRLAPCANTMPFAPPCPLIVSPRSATWMPAPSTTMPSPEDNEMPAYTPGGATIAIDLPIVTGP
jgi:hypothetical protein